ncbi:MAG: dCTP deaminase [archaeon]
MLSDRDILAEIQTKNIFISPFDKKNLLPASYVIHLDSLFGIPKKGKIDLQKIKDFSKFFEEKELDKFVLKPGSFVLVRTLEKVAISQKIGAFVNGKSTLSRLGVSVHQTATLVHPGHGVPTPRKIVLEVKNDGPFELYLTPGLPFAELIFFELRNPAEEPYDLKGIYGKKENLDKLIPFKE